jgi:hypothetical protein
VSFHSGAGFAAGYPPPREVAALRFTDAASLAWDPDPSVGAYEAYRDLLSTLPGGFGTCFASGLGSEAAGDAAAPASRQGWFYLVTARNLLGEEGTKGFLTSGAERANLAPCP